MELQQFDNCNGTMKVVAVPSLAVQWQHKQWQLWQWHSNSSNSSIMVVVAGVPSLAGVVMAAQTGSGNSSTGSGESGQQL